MLRVRLPLHSTCDSVSARWVRNHWWSNHHFLQCGGQTIATVQINGSTGIARLREVEPEEVRPSSWQYYVGDGQRQEGRLRRTYISHCYRPVHSRFRFHHPVHLCVLARTGPLIWRSGGVFLSWRFSHSTVPTRWRAESPAGFRARNPPCQKFRSANVRQFPCRRR